MKHITILTVFILLFPTVYSATLELTPGECFNPEENVSICCQTSVCNVTELCYGYVNNETVESYREILDFLSSMNSSVSMDLRECIAKSLNVTDYYSQCLEEKEDLAEKINDLNVEVDKLAVCKQDLLNCNTKVNKTKDEIEKEICGPLRSELKKAENNQYFYSGLTLLIGVAGTWYLMKRNIPERKGLETHPPRAGF
jgi:hypothetical protein